MSGEKSDIKVISVTVKQTMDNFIFGKFFTL